MTSYVFSSANMPCRRWAGLWKRTVNDRFSPRRVSARRRGIGRHASCRCRLRCSECGNQNSQSSLDSELSPDASLGLQVGSAVHVVVLIKVLLLEAIYTQAHQSTSERQTAEDGWGMHSLNWSETALIFSASPCWMTSMPGVFHLR
jgi:hypothetical protein